MSDYVVETIERDGCTGKIMVEEFAEMPDFDGDGHIIELSYLSSRTEVRNADCLRVPEAENLAAAVSAAHARWGLDWVKIERYLRAFYDVSSFEYTHWDRDRHMLAIATRGLARDGWGNPDGVVNLAPYQAFRDGEVYGYTVDDEDGANLDSCWGYYGDSEIDYIRKIINEVIDDRVRAKHQAAVEMYARMVNRASR